MSGYKLDSGYWMYTAIQRIVAGESETACLADYGYIREAKLTAETARADELQGRYEQCSKNYKDLAELWKAETARADRAELCYELLAKDHKNLLADLETEKRAYSDLLCNHLSHTKDGNNG